MAYIKAYLIMSVWVSSVRRPGAGRCPCPPGCRCGSKAARRSRRPVHACRSWGAYLQALSSQPDMSMFLRFVDMTWTTRSSRKQMSAVRGAGRPILDSQGRDPREVARVVRHEHRVERGTGPADQVADAVGFEHVQQGPSSSDSTRERSGSFSGRVLSSSFRSSVLSRSAKNPAQSASAGLLERITSPVTASRRTWTSSAAVKRNSAGKRTA